jgi:hypothetical protein
MLKHKYFFCYDVEKHLKIKEQGIRYICSAISNSGKRFWLYEQDEGLHKIINQ